MKYLMTHSMPYAIALPRFTHCIYLYMYIYIIFLSVFCILRRFSQKNQWFPGKLPIIGWDMTRQMLKLNCLPPHGRPPRLPAPDTRFENIVWWEKGVVCDMGIMYCTHRSIHIYTPSFTIWQALGTC